MQASSIGIIGGADGPTAIYLAGKFSPWSIAIIVVGAAALITLIAGMFIKRK